MPDVTLPPDQSQRISTLGEKTLILSVSDAGVIVGDGTPYEDFTPFKKGVHIFSEGLGFTSSVLSPHGLSISVNSITAPGSTVISTAGIRGEDEAGVGHPPQSGQAGGALNFYVQRGTDQDAKNISYLTKGGRGGDTITSGGQAGNGGNGGDLVRIFQSVYSKLFEAVATFLVREDVASGDNNMPIVKGDAIHTAALTLTAYSTSDMSTVDPNMQALKEKISAIASGTACTLHDLVLAVKRVRNSVVEAIDTQSTTSFQSSFNCDGGDPGSGKGVVGKTGAYGKAGKDHRLLLTQHDASYRPLDDTLSLRNVTFPFAHPEQCAMLLTRANMFYYMGSPILLNQASQMFRRVIDRLSFLPLATTDPLYVAYSKSSLMPGSSINTLTQILKDATTQLTHIASGTDFNGHTSTWVPRASYTFYKSMLDTALSDLDAFEKAYVAYYAALSRQEELQDSIGQALKQTNSMIAGIVADMNDLQTQLSDAEYQIRALTQPAIDAHYTLINEYDRLKGKIKSSFNLSVPQVINALTSVMFATNTGMTSLQIWNLSYQGFESVPNLDGHPVNKDRLIGKLKQSEATIQGIQDTLSKSKLDGTFELDDPLGTRLLADEDSMMSFLDDFAHTSFEDVIEEMKTKFDDYVKAVSARNKEVLQYNVVLKHLVEKRDTKTTYVEKHQELQGRVITASDPDLPAITDYMNSIYQSSRARVMKGIDLLVRSLNFRMLQTNDIFTIAFSQGADSDTVPLTLTSVVLSSARSHVETTFGEAVEGLEPSKFPPDFDSPQGKRINLKSAEWNTLISESTGYTVDVNIPTVFKETKPSNDFSGACNVRIYRVRFGIVGLKLGLLPTSARVTVNLVHQGTDSFVDKLNAQHVYTHDRVSVLYSFTLNSDGSINVLDNGNIAEADVNNVATSYAAPGPFTTWTVSLGKSELSKLDFSDVKGAYFDFCGTNYAL